MLGFQPLGYEWVTILSIVLDQKCNNNSCPVAGAVHYCEISAKSASCQSHHMQEIIPSIFSSKQNKTSTVPLWSLCAEKKVKSLYNCINICNMIALHKWSVQFGCISACENKTAWNRRECRSHKVCHVILRSQSGCRSCKYHDVTNYDMYSLQRPWTMKEGFLAVLLGFLEWI